MKQLSKLKMIITIPFKTPTINHLYYHHGNIKVLKTGARELREQINWIVTEQIAKDPTLLAILQDRKLEVNIDIYEDWYCKNKTVKKKDIANREKFLVDSVFKALEIDDKFIFRHSINKVQSVTEKAVVTITPI